MAEISKGKRSTGRRSSILKRALADLDTNVVERPEPVKSKRVSFAETCCIKEFQRDSPRILKVAGHNDSADSSADGSLQDADVSLNTSDSSNAPVAQSDKPAGSSFMLDEETTLNTEVMNHGGFRESTRCFDKVDACTFGEAGGLDLSAIAQGENAAFVSAPLSHRHTAARPTTSGNQHVESKPQTQPQPAVGRTETKPAPALIKRTAELNFPSEGDRTLIFDNQDDATMDLTLMDVTSKGNLSFQQPSPKVSARDFLKKAREMRAGPQEARAEGERTVVFSNTGGNAMELTQNLTERNFTGEFMLDPQPFSALEEVVSAPANHMPKASAKSFLASLMRISGSVPGDVQIPENAASKKPDVLNSSLGGCRGEQGGSLGLTSVDSVSKHVSQAISVSKPVESGAPKLPTTVDHEEEFTEMMELTGCIDHGVKPLVEGSSVQDTSRSRNALMDITARCSLSPPPEGQQETDKKQVVTFVDESRVNALPHSAPVVQDFTEAGQTLTERNSKDSNATEVFAEQEKVDSNSMISLNKQSSVASHKPARPSSSPVTSAARRMSTHKTVLFGEETAANMSLTCTDLSSKRADNKAPGSRSVVFGQEETAADMSMTCADLQTHHTNVSSRPADNKTPVNRSVTFVSEAKTAEMSLTCADLQKSRVDPGEKSGMFPTNDTAANMSFTCADLTHGPLHDANRQSAVVPATRQSSQKDRVDKEPATTTNVSLTCASAPSKLAGRKSLTDRSVLFRPEETLADMSMTCADLAPVSKKSVLFKADSSAANMSFTCDLPQKAAPPESKQLNSSVLPRFGSQQLTEKSVVFSKEATAANMSLTCADLSSSRRIKMSETLRSEENKTTFKPDLVDASQKVKTALPEKPKSSEKSILFSKEATAANMSLTCVDLPAARNSESKEKSPLEESGISLNPSNRDKNGDPGVHHLSEKSILFSKDATVANMSLTCVDVLVVQRAEEERSAHREERPAGDQDQDITTTTHHDQSIAVVDMTCTSPVANKQEAKMDEAGIQKKSDILVDVESRCVESNSKLNRTQPLPSDHDAAEGQPNHKSALVTRVFDQSQESCPGEAKEEEDDDDVFFKREPTTLMDIRNVLDNLRRKSEGGGPSGETEAKTATESSPTTPPSEQAKPENGLTSSSRKLQLASSPLTKKATDGSLFSSPLKRHLPSLSSLNDPASKVPRLSTRADVCSPAASQSLETFREPKPRLAEVEERFNKTVDSLSSASGSKGSTDSSVSLVLNRYSSSSGSGGSNSSHGSRLADIFSETMPVFGAAMEASTSAMSMSTLLNATGSFLSLGKSFAEKQERVEEGEGGSSFLQTCERLGLMQSDLKGWVCRRSSMAAIPEVSCDTVEERLNAASVVTQECESKLEFVSTMEARQQREEASTEELEKTVMRQIHEQGLVAEAEQSPVVRQQIRSLLFASRKQAQVQWKTEKALRLNCLADSFERHSRAISADVEDMSNGIERMVTLKETVDEGISQIQSRLESLKRQVPSKTKDARLQAKQTELQQRRTDLAALQEKVDEAKRSVDHLARREEALRGEVEHVKQRRESDQERQKQLARCHQSLFALHCLHCWRPVRVEDERVDLCLLYDAVLLSVRLFGCAPAPEQPVDSIAVTSRLAEGSEPWAVLATELVVDSLTSSSQHLVNRFSSRQQLPSLLDTVTGVVEDVKQLCQQVKMAALRHPVTIRGKQVTVALWSVEKLRRVTLTADIPVHGYPDKPLNWSAHVVMGDIGEGQVQAAISRVAAGRNHFAQVVQTALTLIQQ